jgi:hypothetical protein
VLLVGIQQAPSTHLIRKVPLRPMAQKLNHKGLVNFKELLMANSIQVDTLAQLLIEKGLITQEEFFKKLKEVQAEYESKKAKG